MKRTQHTVLLAGLLSLSLSLAACSYMPWRNTSGTAPAPSTSSGSQSGSEPAADPGPSAGASSSAGDKSASGAAGMTK